MCVWSIFFKPNLFKSGINDTVVPLFDVFFFVIVHSLVDKLFEHTKCPSRVLSLTIASKNFENTNINLIKEEYNPEDFYAAIKIKENPELAKEKEKGMRCYRCYEFRLKKAFEYAKKNDFDYFCTTLSISLFKDAEKINAIVTDNNVPQGYASRLREKNIKLYLA